MIVEPEEHNQSTSDSRQLAEMHLEQRMNGERTGT